MLKVTLGQDFARTDGARPRISTEWAIDIGRYLKACHACTSGSKWSNWILFQIEPLLVWEDSLHALSQEFFLGQALLVFFDLSRNSLLKLFPMIRNLLVYVFIIVVFFGISRCFHTLIIVTVTFLMVSFNFSHVQIYVTRLIWYFGFVYSSEGLSPATILNGTRACFICFLTDTTHRLIKLLLKKVSFTTHLVVLRPRFVHGLI